MLFRKKCKCVFFLSLLLILGSMAFFDVHAQETDPAEKTQIPFDLERFLFIVEEQDNPYLGLNIFRHTIEEIHKEWKELEAQQANARELEALSKLGSPSGYVKTIGNANVRTGPGAKYDKIGSLPKNVLFTAYSVKDGWTQVDAGGFGAWIANSNLATCDANGMTEADKKPA